ncbi:hypothetical protein AU467_19610 [Mesorhizobium loti]|uniref:Uncharacterized protein n=1 Tax=Rhizobium loti TaxID=381 RepID=A0A101KTK5_RHILI|nr:hypothetical protein AU467_19610 [Mesorhizobium loti]
MVAAVAVVLGFLDVVPLLANDMRGALADAFDEAVHAIPAVQRGAEVFRISAVRTCMSMGARWGDHRICWFLTIRLPTREFTADSARVLDPRPG